jgi:hypothetical protein
LRPCSYHSCSAVLDLAADSIQASGGSRGGGERLRRPEAGAPRHDVQTGGGERATALDLAAAQGRKEGAGDSRGRREGETWAVLLSF